MVEAGNCRGGKGVGPVAVVPGKTQGQGEVEQFRNALALLLKDVCTRKEEDAKKKEKREISGGSPRTSAETGKIEERKLQTERGKKKKFPERRGKPALILQRIKYCRGPGLRGRTSRNKWKLVAK